MRLLKEGSIDDLVFLQAAINYTEFHFLCGKKIISSYTLKYYEKRATHFLRVNNSILINPNFIENVDIKANPVLIKLSNGLELAASRRRGVRLRGQLASLFESNLV